MFQQSSLHPREKGTLLDLEQLHKQNLYITYSDIFRKKFKKTSVLRLKITIRAKMKRAVVTPTKEHRFILLFDICCVF